MCRRSARAAKIGVAAALVASLPIVCAQTPASEWRHIGSSVMELGLPSPATGPVNSSLVLGGWGQPVRSHWFRPGLPNHRSGAVAASHRGFRHSPSRKRPARGPGSGGGLSIAPGELQRPYVRVWRVRIPLGRWREELDQPYGLQGDVDSGSRIGGLGGFSAGSRRHCSGRLDRCLALGRRRALLDGTEPGAAQPAGAPAVFHSVGTLWHPHFIVRTRNAGD